MYSTSISDDFLIVLHPFFGFRIQAGPGNIQHIFSFSLSVKGESTVKLAGIVVVK